MTSKTKTPRKLNKIEEALEDLNDALREVETAFKEHYQHFCVQVPFWVETNDRISPWEQKNPEHRKDILAHLIYEHGRLWVEYNGKQKQPATSTSRHTRVALTDALPALSSVLELHRRAQKEGKMK